MSGDLTFIEQPVDKLAVEGGTVVFSAEALGTLPIVYQWYKNDKVLPGAVTKELRVQCDIGGRDARYYCVVTNRSGHGEGTITSSVATLIYDRDSTTTIGVDHEHDIALDLGQRSSTRRGKTVPTQPNSNIPMVVSSSDTPAKFISDVPAKPLDAPPNYGSPIITAQPISVSVIVGASATFRAEASGSAPLIYAWYVNGSRIGNVTGKVLKLGTDMTTPAKSEVYCTVRNAYGNSTSATAYLFVNGGTSMSTTASGVPVITTQPASINVNQSSMPTLSIVAVNPGTDTLLYQWYRNSALISGATSASYMVPTVNSGDIYYVTVTNSAGTVTSASATLTIVPSPSIVVQPFDTSVVVGQSASFTITIQSPNPTCLTYQWYGPAGAIQGATSAVYIISVVSSITYNAPYYCLVTDCSGSTSVTVTSDTAYLTATAAYVSPVIVTPPRSVAAIAGGDAVFSVSAIGSGALTYSWYVNGQAMMEDYPVLRYGPVTTDYDGYQVFVVVTNAYGSVTSSTATLTVVGDSDPSIITQPKSVTVKSGQPASFSVVATSTQTITYQWFNQFGAITGMTLSTYSITKTTRAQNGWKIYCVVTSSAGTITSNVAYLNVSYNLSPLIWIIVLIAIVVIAVIIVIIVLCVTKVKKNPYKPVATAATQVPAPAPQPKVAAQ